MNRLRMGTRQPQQVFWGVRRLVSMAGMALVPEAWRRGHAPMHGERLARHEQEWEAGDTHDGGICSSERAARDAYCNWGCLILEGLLAPRLCDRRSDAIA
jgi:hypothetical protein